MNTKSEAEIKGASTAAPEANTTAPVDDADDWLQGITPQASCNLDGTCESCQ